MLDRLICTDPKYVQLELQLQCTKIMNLNLWDQSGGVFRKEAEKSGGWNSGVWG